MTDKEKNLITKFLNLHYGDLSEIVHLEGQFIALGKKNTSKKIFLYEQKHNTCYVNSNIVIEPIFKMFNTDYQETYDFVKSWLKEKYGLDGDELVGLKPD
jgi:hypothetical protein